VFIESSPKVFHQWFFTALANLVKSTNTPPILFVNAWNEWAGGIISSLTSGMVGCTWKL